MNRILSTGPTPSKEANPRPAGATSDCLKDGEHASDLGTDTAAVNILIVDDEPKNLVVLETILDDPHYRLVRADSGEQALIALLAEEFALLILDIRMPGMTGFELARMVKERRKTAQVPIIFLTAYYNEDQHVIDGYGSGAVDYLLKPVSPTILRSKVRVFVHLYRKQRRLEVANRTLVAEIDRRTQAEERIRELKDTLEQRVQAQTEALRRSLQRLQAINDGSLEYMILLEPDGIILEANRGALEFANVKFKDLVGAPLWDMVWFQSDPEASRFIREAVARAAGGEGRRFELKVKDANQEVKTLDIAVRPIANEHGEIALILFAALDISARKAAEQSVRTSERRLREILDSLPIAVYGVGTDGRLTDYNPACVDLVGVAPEWGVTQWCVSSRLLDTNGAPMRLEDSPMATALRTNRSMEGLELIIERPDGSRRWVAAYPTIMRSAEGDVAGGVNILVDITDRKLNEGRISLLMDEVDHRCKNILSVVQAIARQTALGGLDDFMPRFFERIIALGASHDLLVESRWRGADIFDLVRAHLRHFDNALTSRIVLNGESIGLSNAAAQTIGMVLHELATNAVKYGALSEEAGKVEISWHAKDNGVFSIAWNECGGPPVAEPTRRGFGSTVIKAMAESSFAGKVDLAFGSEGLSWRLVCPTAKILESENESPMRVEVR